MFYAGVDAGSRTIKVALFDETTMSVVASGVRDQGIGQADRAYELFESVLSGAGADHDDVGRIIATGYGRNALLWADTAVTEITCQARGIKEGYPDVRTIIDIGGEDSKLIRLDRSGAVRDFAMNDRCAAGTGRFLEIAAKRLDKRLLDLGRMSANADAPAAISSMCAVFAESEIVGLLAADESPENIIAGVERSIAKRVVSMAGTKVEEPVVFTGGVALVPGMKEALQEALGLKVTVADSPQLTAAYGAAVIAALSGELYAKNIK
jgi:predicted CoA-substrate-specific enzyme activase